MARSTLASTMSRLDRRLRKGGQWACISRSSASPASPCAARKVRTAEPKPYQPGSMRRHWPQLKTQGMARRSVMARPPLRLAGREPMFSREISEMGVDSQK